MLDKVEYWLELADDDISAIKTLLNGQNYLHAGFFCHLVVEKALKAAIAYTTSEVPPKIHQLLDLAELAKVFDDLSEEQKKLLSELNPLNIDSRYPEYKERIVKTLSAERITRIFKETEAFLCWIKKKLEK